MPLSVGGAEPKSHTDRSTYSRAVTDAQNQLIVCSLVGSHKFARSIINKKTELNIMVDDIKPHIIGITESWANNDITNAELGLEGYVMFWKDIIGRRGGGVLLYIKDTIPAYEVQLQEEADCNDAIWCNLVTGHTTVIIGVVYRCPNITKQNNEKIHNAINEVSKGDCIIMGDFNHGNI